MRIEFSKIILFVLGIYPINCGLDGFSKLTPSIGKLDDDEIYYSFGYQANGVNTAPWSGNELSKLIISNSKVLNISKFYQGLPKKFPFPKLRLFYLRLYLMYCSIIDR